MSLDAVARLQEEAPNEGVREEAKTLFVVSLRNNFKFSRVLAASVSQFFCLKSLVLPFGLCGKQLIRGLQACVTLSLLTLLHVNHWMLRVMTESLTSHSIFLPFSYFFGSLRRENSSTSKYHVQDKIKGNKKLELLIRTRELLLAAFKNLKTSGDTSFWS